MNDIGLYEKDWPKNECHFVAPAEEISNTELMWFINNPRDSYRVEREKRTAETINKLKMEAVARWKKEQAGKGGAE